jgi:hypothetical protein
MIEVENVEGGGQDEVAGLCELGCVSVFRISFMPPALTEASAIVGYWDERRIYKSP